MSSPVAKRIAWSALLLAATILVGCRKGAPAQSSSGPVPRVSILLVTLDTTRADAIGPHASNVRTPSFNALAGRGRLFEQAYATAPETLPSHASMMTGLYPAGHGIHENGRYVPTNHELIAERLHTAGYRTAAFISSFVLSRRFGLARGFDVYDEELSAGRAERPARETTDRAVEFLEKTTEAPVFVWVHYFDPHAPYEPPDEFRREYGARPYYGEIAAMDEQLGRLIRAFDEHAARAGVEPAFLVVADHGEGLGDHGESQHGNLLYQATIHVPLIAAGPGFPPGMSSEPVSTRRVFHTLLDWARLEGANSLHSPTSDVVAAEAMKPFLNYGWQPQIMAVEGHRKAIFAGRTEVYDIAVDPAEARDLGGGTALSTAMRKVLDEYPVPASAAGSHDDALSNDARRALASLGYVSATATPVVRKDAPRPADMVRLFERIERASALFVAERYGEVIPLLNDIVKEDPNNLDAVLRLATAYSSLGREADALAAFARARTLAPESQDVRLYLALHYARGQDWARAVPELERIVAATPERVPALEALARIRERQGRIAEAVAIRTKVYGLRDATAAELIRQGEQAMSIQATDVAIDAFERARTRDTRASPHDLELGVLYLSVRKYDAARNALDRVPATHPDYPMALFKRAQVSVLLNEPDAPARIEAARRHADSTTRTLIAREKLFTAVR